MKWVSQLITSYNLMTCNISPEDTAKGAIVASISKQSPNYWFSWTRDSALTMNVLSVLQVFTNANPELNLKLQTQEQLDVFFNNYASFSYKNQRTETMSAGIDDSNLGEPRFNVDGSASNVPWGRVQNDGPAMRSLTLIRYLRSSGRSTDWYSSNFDSLIKMDCEYVAKKVNSPCIDLWEENYGMHFYNAVAYDKSLEACGKIATSSGDIGAADYYLKQRQISQQNIKKHMNGDYIIQTYNPIGGSLKKASNMDIAAVLAIIHTDVNPDDVVYASHPKALATVATLQNAFIKVYPINNNPDSVYEAKKHNLGFAFGRYPEDTYNGVDNSDVANPWFLATAAIAEYYYTLIEEYTELKEIEVNQANKIFFTDVLGRQMSNSLIKSDNPIFGDILNQLFNLADKQLHRMMVMLINVVSWG